MKKHLLLFISLFIIGASNAQTDTLHNKNLREVVITAYESDANAISTPAAIGILNTQDLERFSNTNILSAVNNIPGIKMEERSPGSYRLGMRGSSYNSPFGVRNVKVYYNDIPYTEPGGVTYLNQLGYSNFQSVTFIKEPGSSLYGAGTGGVMLINSMQDEWQQGAEIQATAGSYGLFNISAAAHGGTKKFKNTIRYQRLSADGYREHAAIQRDVFSWDGKIAAGKKGTLNTHFLYGNLYYQTPGGLTLAQYETSPESARPAAGPAPSAQQNKAAIYQETYLAGMTYKYDLNRNWQHKTTLYAKYTNLTNPNIRNYSKVYQPSFGGRTVLKYDTDLGSAKFNWITGAEYQNGTAFENTYQNNNGIPDTLQQQTEIVNTNTSLFTQLSLDLKRWTIVGGISINQLTTGITSTLPLPYTELTRQFRNQASPRIALLYKIDREWSVFASVSNGFAPPTTEQLAPTGSAINLDLRPTYGWNYQVGTKGYFLSRLYFDITAFYMQLSNAIVQRRDALGGDYYLNAGSTQQPGLEAALRYDIARNPNAFISYAAISGSYTGYKFQYNEFVQVTNNYSGNAMPGVPSTVVTLSADISTRIGLYTNLNSYYTGSIALNDANDAYASPYTIVDVRLGYLLKLNRMTVDIFGGINNLLNEQYSLGNDINALGDRYYNAAPGINYFAGLRFIFMKRRSNDAVFY